VVVAENYGMVVVDPASRTVRLGLYTLDGALASEQVVALDTLQP
jgi:hypothetical protein